MSRLSQQRRQMIGAAGFLTVCCLYVYVFLEWLFFATKPSFLSSYTLVERLGALGSAPLFFLPAVIAAFGLSVILYVLLDHRLESKRITLLAIVPAGIATIITVLLIDNFTYTVFKTGIIRTREHQPYVWLMAIILFWRAWSIWFTGKIIGDDNTRWRRWVTPGLLLFSLLSCVAVVAFAEGFEEETEFQNATNDPPNIVMFAADGIQASNVSTYGYHRQTTPNLDELSKDALVVYNAVSNAGRTTGSITAMLSGKYPATTKVIFPPHVLRGRHTYQHLPAILKKLGYVNFQESVIYYADSHDLNMHSGFDVANGRVIEEKSSYLPEHIRYRIFPLQLFSQRLWERVKNRALHLVGYRPMVNAFDLVNSAEIAPVYEYSDQKRMSRAIDFIKTAEQPFFVHVHLMGPHCCEHFPDTRKYSVQHSKQNRDNFEDFYDDTIIDSDIYFSQIVEQLRKEDRFDNSLIIYSSDHTRGWRTTKSVPLVIRFPGGENSGKRGGITELIDVAPTITDYLGLPPFKWMEGRSLLNEAPSPRKMAFMVDSVKKKRVRGPTQQLSQLVGGGPPLYGMKTLALLNCDTSYLLDIEEGELISQEFDMQEDKCVSTLRDEEAKKLLESHLINRGFTLPYQKYLGSD